MFSRRSSSGDPSPANKNQTNQSFWSVKIITIITATAFASTYLGIWLQQTAFKFAPVDIAQT